ncbi:MAG: hypothetical protein R3D63_03440 [Paracoccaceae bacterium]
MSMLRSPPDGLQQLGWLRLALTGLAFCLAPAVTGALIMATVGLFGSEILGQNSLHLQGMATFAMVSPLIGLPIWAMIVLASAMLMKFGSYGWLPAAVVGMLAFGVLSRTGIGSISMAFGAVSVLMFRMALALQRPDSV